MATIWSNRFFMPLIGFSDAIVYPEYNQDQSFRRPKPSQFPFALKSEITRINLAIFTVTGPSPTQRSIPTSASRTDSESFLNDRIDRAHMRARGKTTARWRGP